MVRILVFTFLGLLVGIGSAFWMGGMLPGAPRMGNAVEIDGWVSDWSIGSESASPYVRARVARNGLLGLRKEEAVYFMKMTDEAGQRLSEDCTYEVTGGSLPAEWWSITLYDADNRLPMNIDAKLSFDQTQAELMFEGADAQWQFRVAPRAPDDASMPWVSSKAGGAFDLTLRLYRPTDAILANPEAVLAPPKVTRLSCEEAST